MSKNPWLNLSEPSTTASDASSSEAPWILVVAGVEHRVGASLTALAIASAAETAGFATALIDGAVPRWSGLHTALEAEGPLVGAGVPVSEGRRDGLRVRSLAWEVASPPVSELLGKLDGIEVVIVDAGVSLPELKDSRWLERASAWLPVAGVTIPGLARGEAALEDLMMAGAPAPVGLTGIGTALDPHRMAGPRTGKALDAGWWPVPRNGQVEVSGATPDRLPPPMTEAGAQILRATGPQWIRDRVLVPTHGFWKTRRKVSK